ncbi:hypothetical protein [Pantoea sp. 1.19]|uniref:hypothetical protein n=1 Tax=Pantoea sp. 1.19 TaxID=1925589 RepID=UPI0009489ED5|nr:hypothetical protein [Pantoea sp. 1.19]
MIDPPEAHCGFSEDAHEVDYKDGRVDLCSVHADIVWQSSLFFAIEFEHPTLFAIRQVSVD